MYKITIKTTSEITYSHGTTYEHENEISFVFASLSNSITFIKTALNNAINIKDAKVIITALPEEKTEKADNQKEEEAEHETL